MQAGLFLSYYPVRLSQILLLSQSQLQTLQRVLPLKELTPQLQVSDPHSHSAYPAQVQQAAPERMQAHYRDPAQVLQRARVQELLKVPVLQKV